MPVRAYSKGCTIRRVEIPSNKLLATAFEASLECITACNCELERLGGQAPLTTSKEREVQSKEENQQEEVCEEM